MFLIGQAEYLRSCECMGSCLAIERSMKSRTFECGPSPCGTCTSTWCIDFISVSRPFQFFTTLLVILNPNGRMPKKKGGGGSHNLLLSIRYHRLSGQKSVQGTPIIIHCAEQRDVKSEFVALWSPFQLHLSSLFHYRNLTPQVQRAWPENSPRQSSWLKDVTLGCEMDVLLLFFWGGAVEYNLMTFSLVNLTLVLVFPALLSSVSHMANSPPITFTLAHSQIRWTT